MPPGWAVGDRAKCPAWIESDPHRAFTDDGTPAGLFERAQLLLWSSEPINQWHAIGYGHHRLITRPFDTWRIPGLSLPVQWLPEVERHQRASDVDDVELPEEASYRFENGPCDVVRFWTSCSLGIEAIYRFTVLMNEDSWHYSAQSFPTGEGGYIV